MTVTEPSFEEPVATMRPVRRAHRAPLKARVMAQWTTAPTWFRRAVAVPGVILGAYLGWTFLLGPTLRAAAAHEARAQVNAAYGDESKSLTDTIAAYVDQRIGAAQQALPPVVVVDAPLSWLRCGVGLDAQGLIGAEPNTNGTKLNVARSQQVSNDVQRLMLQVPLSQIRVTRLADNSLRVGSEGVLVAAPCDAPTNATPAAGVTTATTAPAAITPPQGAN